MYPHYSLNQEGSFGRKFIDIQDCREQYANKDTSYKLGEIDNSDNFSVVIFYLFKITCPGTSPNHYCCTKGNGHVRYYLEI